MNGASMCIQHAMVWLAPRVLGTPPRFICRTNSVDKVHAQLDGRKMIFSCVARMICPQFYSRKNTQVLAGCAQTPDAFPPALLHQVDHSNATQLSTLSTSSYHSKRLPFLWFCALPNFPLLGVNGFLFAVVRLVCIRKLPLCAGVSDPTLRVRSQYV